MGIPGGSPGCVARSTVGPRRGVLATAHPFDSSGVFRQDLILPTRERRYRQGESTREHPRHEDTFLSFNIQGPRLLPGDESRGLRRGEAMRPDALPRPRRGRTSEPGVAAGAPRKGMAKPQFGTPKAYDDRARGRRRRAPGEGGAPRSCPVHIRSAEPQRGSTIHVATARPRLARSRRDGSGGRPRSRDAPTSSHRRARLR